MQSRRFNSLPGHVNPVDVLTTYMLLFITVTLAVVPITGFLVLLFDYLLIAIVYARWPIEEYYIYGIKYAFICNNILLSTTEISCTNKHYVYLIIYILVK